ncbi:MAG TPA: hypothetical protein VNO22_08260 [Planctomycetota bacterium]|jgi:hypothetical protein|nr:hypothetical protein [Planctomycetota bacterium]
MKLVRTEEARPGQRAARDVVDLRGNVLFPAGTVLTPEILVQCRDRHVAHLFVDEDGAGAPTRAADLEARREALSREIDATFAGTESDPVMAALREAARRYLLARIR